MKLGYRRPQVVDVYGVCKRWNPFTFGCMTASDSVFDSMDGFCGSTYPTKT